MSVRDPYTLAQAQEHGYLFARELQDGSIGGVLPMTYGKGRLCLGCGEFGYEEGYCYESVGEAIAALCLFDPMTMTEPTGWFRDLQRGRRRPDKTPASEYVHP